MIDADFEYFLEKFGQPQQAVRVTDNILNKYKGKLPDQLLEYWKEVGFCTFKGLCCTNLASKAYSAI